MSATKPTWVDCLEPGNVRAQVRGTEVQVSVVDADRIGVVLRSVRVQGGPGAELARHTAGLPDALRVLPDRIIPIEFAPGLGGAVLRSRPEDIENGRFFEVYTTGQMVDIRRLQRTDTGRTDAVFSLTREQLRSMVDRVADLLPRRPEG